jgi:flagellar biosynthesis protein FlhA
LSGDGKNLAHIAIPFGILMVVVVMVIPLPVMLLDTLLATNIAIAIVVLLTAMLVREPLEFSVFPALLLVTTLFRLALNVSTTRLILSHGEGGKVIEAFGGFVVAGNLIIGLVIFAILVVIQFAVVTSGAGRVAEVGARFTLDAMPGKQMAIDADLNAGLITEADARKRRLSVAREADFYGSMDGASKFVKGDAIAAVVIVLVCLFGGVAIGVLEHGLSVSESIKQFALLSVGDGLVSQIPALLISVASGVIVTRSVSDQDGGLGAELFTQLLQNRRVLGIAAAALTAVALLPGIPKLPFLFLAAMFVVLRTRANDGQRATETEAAPVVATVPEDEAVAELRVEPLELELATDMFDLADSARGGTLLERVRGLRRQIARELGIVLPLVRTRDNVLLTPSTYVIRLYGVEIGRGQAPPAHVLVLAGDDGPIAGGIPTNEPVFGLPAAWVPEQLADHHRALGATVVDRSSVLVTHLSDVVRRNAGALLSRQDVQQLIDGLRHTAPALLEDIGANGVSLAEIHAILRALLDDMVPIRDLVRILEAVTARARDTRDREQLVEAARQVLAAAISAQAAPEGALAAITLDPSLEQSLIQARRVGESGSFLDLDAARMERLIRATADAVVAGQHRDRRVALICSPQLRPIMQRLVGRGAHCPPVLSYNELMPTVVVEPVEVIDLVYASQEI